MLVTSNGVAVPFDEDGFAPMAETALAREEPGGMARRLAEDGYVLLRGALDPVSVRRARADYFSYFDPTYFKGGTTVSDGVFSGRRPPELGAHGTAGHPAHLFVRSRTWQRFVEDPALQHLAEIILDGPCSLLPRQIVRHYDRRTAAASRAHVDHTYLDRGSGEIVTFWIPLGDCALATGPLLYLEGSHRMAPEELAALRGVSDRPGDERPLSHDLGWVASRSGRRWLWADFRAGDVAVHSPHLVHASLDVRSEVMRLSADVRFLRHDGVADPRWCTTWSGDDGN